MEAAQNCFWIVRMNENDYLVLKDEFIKTTSCYVDGLKKANSRYKSFDHCYLFFCSHYSDYNDKSVADLLALHLFSYLASWGMMRSEILIQNNYLIHKKACAIIAEKMIQSGKDLSVDDLMKLRDEIKEGYKGISYSKLSYDKVEKECHMEQKKIDKASDTLVTKILLGTTGLVPAYDRFVKRAMKKLGISCSFGKKSLDQLSKFVEANSEAIYDVQERVEKACNIKYPVMKIVDMFLWQKGFELYCISNNESVSF